MNSQTCAEKEAIRLVQEGMALIEAEKMEEATHRLEHSLRLNPTADAWTQLGRIETLQGHFSRAIEYCSRAIEIDPNYGNSYNDIGVCLVRMGQHNRAIVWFQKAKHATRYGTPHYPYLNLGSIYVRMGRMARAYHEFKQVLEWIPDQPEARQFVDAMDGLLEAEAKPQLLN